MLIRMLTIIIGICQLQLFCDVTAQSSLIGGDLGGEQSFSNERLLLRLKEDEGHKEETPYFVNSKNDEKTKEVAAEKQSKENLRLLLEKIDEDGDKYLTRAELHDWITRAYRVLPNIVADEIFLSADKNNDKRISWLEYIKETFDLDTDVNIHKELKGDYPGKRATMNKYKQDEDLWKVTDADKDKYLDYTEWKLFQIAEEKAMFAPLFLHHQIMDRDLNSDGKLSFDEYMRPSTIYHQDRDPIRAKEHFDNELDLNKDGELDNHELQVWLIPDDEKKTQDDGDHLMSEADQDKDGRLSFDEVLNFHHVFRGHSITGYGDQLDNYHEYKDEL